MNVKFGAVGVVDDTVPKRTASKLHRYMWQERDAFRQSVDQTANIIFHHQAEVKHESFLSRKLFGLPEPKTRDTLGAVLKTQDPLTYKPVLLPLDDYKPKTGMRYWLTNQLKQYVQAIPHQAQRRYEDYLYQQMHETPPETSRQYEQRLMQLA